MLDNHGFEWYSVYMKREFTAVYQKQGAWVIAWIEEVPGANTQARTMKEAEENLR